MNDVPTDVLLSNNNVNEDSALGTIIGDLSTIDIDLPKDTITYSLISNPGSLFSISGNKLLLNAALDFEIATSHTISIKADDGNGGDITKLFTINVNDISELSLRPNLLPEAPAGNRNGFQGIKIEEDRRREPPQDTLIHSFSSGQVQDQINAFYGRESFNQIIRENTTFEISAFLNARNKGEALDVSSQSQTQASIDDAVFLNNNDLPIKGDIDVKSIREVLESLKQELEEQQVGDNNIGGERPIQALSNHNENASIYDQFENVLSYHEKRQNDLIQALSKDA